MLPVFMILHSKIYFMRAPARQRKYRIKELYRQTEARQRRAFRVSAHLCAETLSPAVFRRSRNRQGRPAAAGRVKFPRKSRGVYLTFTPLPAPPRRGLVRRADEREVSPPVSPEPEGYPGGTASPLEASPASIRKEQMQSICSLEILF